jgi:glycyl-tRNA synthetase beta chain
MSNYLVEIGVEELPAGFVGEAVDKLKNLMTTALEQAEISFGEIETFSTPRRLAILVRDLDTKQKTSQKKIKGPSVKQAYDEVGVPTRQATGFAEKHGLSPQDLARETIAGVEYLVANLTIEGKQTCQLLPGIMEKIIPQISGERLMRWGSCDVRFSRPLRWFVSLLDADVLPFSFAGLEAGNLSYGHRILHAQGVKIENALTYLANLEKAYVLAAPAQRRTLISRQVENQATALGGKARQLDGGLLDEVVNLTEWPQAVVGQFEDDYLTLPSTLIETIMVHHQRYFPVEGDKLDRFGDKALMPYFITISNNDKENALANIKQGNERVLRARLADGKFFYFDDQKTRLEERTEALKNLTYQEGLGSYAHKTERLIQLASILCNSLGSDAKTRFQLERTAQLMKLDLVSNLVRELPELQGFVGSWYALQEGESKEVSQAIASHYSPRSSSDTIPQDQIGALAALIDKLDHVVGLFAVGKKPTGSSDPFALRRNAQGLIDILMDGLTATPVNLSLLIDSLLLAFEPLLEAQNTVTTKGRKEPARFDRNVIGADIRDFLIQRLKGKLLDKQFGREMVEAVLASRDPLTNLSDVLVRLSTVENLLKADYGRKVMQIAVRIGNILKTEGSLTVNEKLLEGAAEKELWEAFQKKVKSNWQKNEAVLPLPGTEAEYQSLLLLLTELCPYVDKFFEDTLVNDPEEAKRINRQALLRNINTYFKTVADFTKLQPLLV